MAFDYALSRILKRARKDSFPLPKHLPRKKRRLIANILSGSPYQSLCMTMKLLPGCRLLDKLSRNKDLRATSIFITVYLMGTLSQVFGKNKKLCRFGRTLFSQFLASENQQLLERKMHFDFSTHREATRLYCQDVSIATNESEHKL